MKTPPGQCRQCWRHAYDRKAHRHLKPGEDCPQCVDHMTNGHGADIVPKKASSWF